MSNTNLPSVDIGIIGGSGVYNIDGFAKSEEIDINTPFGKPSDSYIIGELNGITVAFLPRHARGHRLLPSELNYRANIYGFKALGVSHIIGISAVGSLREDRPPLDLVIPDQLIDRTRQRQSTFYGNGVVVHIPFAVPFCPDLSQLLYNTASNVAERVHLGGTLVTIEGPTFSTKAESMLYRQWNCDIIGMTTYQEAKLAREAEICYATISMVTDYDCWRESGDDEVTVETIIGYMKQNSANAQTIITRVLPEISQERSCLCHNCLAGSIMTAPDQIPDETREKLSILIDKHLK
ncbi:MAG: S-methyl-5'-thioadenosine phosphorylase [Desulfobulbaceae bacterium]|nr:MAG: S-methyl-5'-thioadenosine phosphorylase [Desulfobulbaceae bacterium]